MSKLIWEPFQWVENKIEIAIINVDKFFKTKKKKKIIEFFFLYLLFSRISGFRQNYWPDIRRLDIQPNQYPVQPYISLLSGEKECSCAKGRRWSIHQYSGYSTYPSQRRRYKYRGVYYLNNWYSPPPFSRGIYFAKNYGGGGGEKNGCWGKKIKTEGVGEKNEKEGKRGKGKRRKTA